MLGKAIITKVLFRCWCFEAKYTIYCVVFAALQSAVVYVKCWNDCCVAE